MEEETFTAYIYQIYDHWDGLRYIGSTTKDVYKRLLGHENAYRRYKRGKTTFTTSFNVLCNGDYDISVIERVGVRSVKELRRIEGKYITTMTCVNKIVAGRTLVELRESNKETRLEQGRLYYSENKEKVKATHTLYTEKNKEIIKQRTAKYRERNQESIVAYRKWYKAKNKERLREEGRQYMEEKRKKDKLKKLEN
jgi:hypothetical protein